MAVSIAERRHSFCFEEYADVAERSPIRVEHWEGAILDMSGGSPRHSAICAMLSAFSRLSCAARRAKCSTRTCGSVRSQRTAQPTRMSP